MTTGNRTQKAINRELQQHQRLQKWLPTIATEEEADSVGVHLGDLYGACEKLRDLIQHLPDLDPIQNRDEIRQDLMLIYVEIYSHMLYHMENLRGGLDVWMERLFDEIEEPEED